MLAAQKKPAVRSFCSYTKYRDKRHYLYVVYDFTDGNVPDFDYTIGQQDPRVWAENSYLRNLCSSPVCDSDTYNAIVRVEWLPFVSPEGRNRDEVLVFSFIVITDKEIDPYRLALLVSKEDKSEECRKPAFFDDAFSVVRTVFKKAHFKKSATCS